jgi:hypothetical protein
MHAEGRATLSAVRRRAGQSSRCRVLTQHGGDLLPAIDPEQLDLTARHEAEEQNDRGVLRSRLRSLWTRLRPSTRTPTTPRTGTLTTLPALRTRRAKPSDAAYGEPAKRRRAVLPVRAGASLRRSADTQTLPRDFEYAVTAGRCGSTFVFRCDGDGESGKGKRMGRRSRPRPHGGSILRAFDGSRRCVE